MGTVKVPVSALQGLIPQSASSTPWCQALVGFLIVFLGQDEPEPLSGLSTPERGPPLGTSQLGPSVGPLVLDPFPTLITLLSVVGQL